MKASYNTMPEITLKMKKSDVIQKQIKSSIDCAEVFRQVFDDSIEIYESMFALYLSRSNKTIGWMKISQGGLSGTVIDTRLILKSGIESLCSSVIICHNHPSGNKQPSEADLKVTQKLKAGCETLEIKLLDHIILTADCYLSLADEGLM